MVRNALLRFERGEYAPADLPLDPNIYGPTVDMEPPGLFVLYRTMSANGVRRIVNSVAALRGPGLGNKRREGTPVGENFYATSLEYARQYTSKGKRRGRGTVTLRFAFGPAIQQDLLWTTTGSGRPRIRPLRTIRTRSSTAASCRSTSWRTDPPAGRRLGRDARPPRIARPVRDDVAARRA